MRSVNDVAGMIFGGLSHQTNAKEIQGSSFANKRMVFGLGELQQTLLVDPSSGIWSICKANPPEDAHCNQEVGISQALYMFTQGLEIPDGAHSGISRPKAKLHW
jgi:hypothetical protein